MLLPTQSTHSCWWYFHTKCPVSCSLPYFYSTVIQKLLNLDIGILKSTRCFGTKCPPPYRFLPFMPWAVYLWHNRLATRAVNCRQNLNIETKKCWKFHFNDRKLQHSTVQYSTVQDSRADRTNVTGNFVMGGTPRQPVLVPFLLGSQQPPSEGDMRNCTADRPCQYGEGVCTEDSHCVPRLGIRNIRNIQY